jgi:hypothetical protein
MKDDYLWDGTGEPDPDIQRLEQTLSRFRYQPRPLAPAFDERLLARRPVLWLRLAAAAAVVLMALVGLWVVKNQHRSDAELPIARDEDRALETLPFKPEGDSRPQPSPQPSPPTPYAGEAAKHLARKRKAVEFKKAQPKDVEPERFDSAPIVADRAVSEIAVAQPIVIPFVDPETSKHIERAQMLLRSFRNIDDGGNQDDSEIAFEKRQSRGLLYQNIVLRRDAEAKGNMPVEDLLGSLEPFLIDIANLPDKPSKDDVLAIKDRMHKKEIVSALQIYSAPTLSQVFQQD